MCLPTVSKTALQFDHDTLEKRISESRCTQVKNNLPPKFWEPQREENREPGTALGTDDLESN